MQTVYLRYKKNFDCQDETSEMTGCGGKECCVKIVEKGGGRMQQSDEAVIRVKDLYKVYRMGEEKVMCAERGQL